MCNEIEQPFTFLVLGDIHFGKFADSPEFRGEENHKITYTKQPSRKLSLIDEVLKLPERPTAIFIPGDLTSIASPSEFKGCIAMAMDIAEALSISRQNVIVTYGNHDTNWSICDLGIEKDKRSADSEYEYVAASIGNLYAPVVNCNEVGPVLGSGVYIVNDHTLFVLNSGFYCVAEQVYRHGRLGSAQLEWIKEALVRYSSNTGWKILMVHHHPFNYRYPTPIEDVSCLEEGAELVDLAGSMGIDLLFHGHRHHPRLFTEMRTEWKFPLTLLCAGSVAVGAHHRDTGLIPNLFHVVSLKRRLENGAAFGNVISFEFTTDGWKPVSNRPATPLDHVHWFGSLVSEQENKDAIKNFITELSERSGCETILLPERNDLPPSLMCCSLDQLNSQLSIIANSCGFRVVGKYPSEVALMKL